MKVVMHELSHCPNCAIVTKLLERKFENDIEIEHRIMDNEQIDSFIEKGLTTSPIVQVDDNYYAASSKDDRESLFETLELMRSH